MLKGILYVLLGAASYGVLATIVKLSYHQGYNVSEVTFAQYSVGLLVLWMLTLLPKKSNTALSKPKKWDVSKLILA